ncbi:MAG: family 43 glycosylhydrolase [Rhodanobacteraceae bacterium]|nr:family 43 glycosylhydrolase [Rhodanobacteraceae bacterium]
MGFPDPAVIRHSDGYWYAYVTGGGVARSTNLVTWAWQPAYTASGGFNWGTQGALPWAPDVVRIGGQYVLYYSLSIWGDTNPGIGIATAPAPTGPWTDRGKLFRSTEIGVENSIDPAVFTAQDGRVFMVWGSFRGNYMIELSADGLALKEPANAAGSKTLIAGAPIGQAMGSAYEGMYVLFRNGYYYLFASIGRCCQGATSTYSVVVLRSTSPTGPYVDRLGRSALALAELGEPVVRGDGTRFVGPGHNSIAIDDGGNWWLVYHSYAYSNPALDRRELMIDKLTWDMDGWPSVANPGNAPSQYPFPP